MDTHRVSVGDTRHGRTYQHQRTGDRAIDQFQAENQELALVIEDGDVSGLVTVTDLLEAVMGDIEDPLDTGQVEA